MEGGPTSGWPAGTCRYRAGTAQHRSSKFIDELRLDFNRDRDQEMYDQNMREYLGIDEEVLKEIATEA